MILVENFALVMGTYFQNVARVMGPNSEFSKAHIYPTPYRSYPPSTKLLEILEATNASGEAYSSNLSNL